MNPEYLLIISLVTIIAILASGSRIAGLLALAGTVVQLVFSAGLLFLYMAERNAGNASLLLFEHTYVWYPDWNITFHSGIDGISLSMILLTSVVLVSGVLVSWKTEYMKKEFFILLLLLGTGAYGFFLSSDLFSLFFFFELAVIPKYLLIAIWGSGRKEYSAMKLALMLMGGSALVLAGILSLYYYSCAAGNPSFDLQQLYTTPVPEQAQLYIFPLLFTGFAVLSALFPLHTWAPDGHSSAPTAASMFLAGISMKLGGYGCIRIAIYLFPAAAAFYSPYIIILACIGILYGAFVTLRQKDIKLMNAYSSVSHCGFVLLGAGMLTNTAMTGAVLQMVSHGIMTALFFGVIGMIYGRTHTRIGEELGGLLKVMPFIGSCFIIAGLTSLGLPGLSGFVAEMTIFVGAFQIGDVFHRIATVSAAMSIVVTAVYILRAIGISLWGPLKNEKFRESGDATWYERAASVILIASIISIGIYPFWMSDIISNTVSVLFTSNPLK